MGGVKHGVAVLERVKRNELGQLTTESLGGAAELMDHDLAGLLVLCEITTLVEATAAGAVHVELGGTNQFDHQSAQSLRSALSSGCDLTLDKVYVLNPSEGVFNLVASRVVVDVVCNTSLLGRVEDNQVHLALADSAPGTDREGATCKVLDDYTGVSSGHMRNNTMLKLTNFSGACIGVEAHGAGSVAVAITAGAHEVREEALSRLKRLHCEMAAHRLGNALAVLTVLNALSCNVLNLGTSAMILDTQRGSSLYEGTYLFWNQIWTDLSVMLISSAILSRTAAVGVGFLLNSTSKVMSWS